MKRLNLIAEKPLQRVKPQEQPVVYAADLDREKYLCFDPAWQAEARVFHEATHKRLMESWKLTTSRSRQYLEARGIDKRTACAALLGLNLEDYRATWGEASVWLPRGIVIPWNINAEYWTLRVRRPNVDVEAKGGDKYMSPKGACGYAMFGIGEVIPGDTVVITEGEFDALLLRRFLLDDIRMNVSVVSIGSNTGARLKQWTYRLIRAKKIYLAFDNDPAGDQASMWWSQALGKKAVRIRPSQKDITEMYVKGELPMFLKEIQ